MDAIRKQGYLPAYTQAQFNNNAALLDPRLTPEEKQLELARLARIANPGRYHHSESQRLQNIFNRRPRAGGLLDQRQPTAEDSLRQLVTIMSDLPGAMENALSKRMNVIADRASNMASATGKLNVQDMENVSYGENIKWLHDFFFRVGGGGGAGTNTVIERIIEKAAGPAQVNITGVNELARTVSQLVQNSKDLINGSATDRQQQTQNMTELIKLNNTLMGRIDSMLVKSDSLATKTSELMGVLSSYMTRPQEEKDVAAAISDSQFEAMKHQMTQGFATQNENVSGTLSSMQQLATTLKQSIEEFQAYAKRVDAKNLRQQKEILEKFTEANANQVGFQKALDGALKTMNDTIASYINDHAALKSFLMSVLGERFEAWMQKVHKGLYNESGVAGTEILLEKLNEIKIDSNDMPSQLKGQVELLRNQIIPFFQLAQQAQQQAQSILSQPQSSQSQPAQYDVVQTNIPIPVIEHQISQIVNNHGVDALIAQQEMNTQAQLVQNNLGASQLPDTQSMVGPQHADAMRDAVEDTATIGYNDFGAMSVTGDDDDDDDRVSFLGETQQKPPGHDAFVIDIDNISLPGYQQQKTPGHAASVIDIDNISLPDYQSNWDAQSDAPSLVSDAASSASDFTTSKKSINSIATTTWTNNVDNLIVAEYDQVQKRIYTIEEAFSETYNYLKDSMMKQFLVVQASVQPNGQFKDFLTATKRWAETQDQAVKTAAAGARIVNLTLQGLEHYIRNAQRFIVSIDRKMPNLASSQEVQQDKSMMERMLAFAIRTRDHYKAQGRKYMLELLRTQEGLSQFTDNYAAFMGMQHSPLNIPAAGPVSAQIAWNALQRYMEFNAVQLSDNDTSSLQGLPIYNIKESKKFEAMINENENARVMKRARLERQQRQSSKKTMGLGRPVGAAGASTTAPVPEYAKNWRWDV